METSNDKEWALFDVIDAMHEFSVKGILDEMKQVRPDVYLEIEKYFRFQEVDQKLCALLNASQR